MLYTTSKARKPIFKTIRRIITSALVLVVLFIVAGDIYVYFGDRTIKPKANPTVSHPQEKTSLPTPPKPDPKARENVSIQSLLTPVNPGQNTSIQIQTNITSTCSILVSYNNVPSTDSGLTPKPADAYGNVSWTWTVPRTAPIGTWPVKVTCVYNGRSGVVIGNLQVTSSMVQ